MIVTNFRLRPLIKSLVTVIAILLVIFSSCQAMVQAATEAQTDDVNHLSEWDDQESISCSDSVSVTQSATTSTPGKIFVLGDSIGQGLSGALPTDLKDSDGWNITSDTRVGRSLSEGITIAKSKPANLAAAQYVIVVLGTNPDSKMTGAGIQDMIDAIKEANPSAPILWLGLNVSRSDLVNGATEFNNLLKTTSQIKYLDNNTTISADGVHPSSYTELSTLVSKAITNGTSSSVDTGSCVCSVGTASGQNVDKNMSLGSDPAERRTNLMKLLVGDYQLSAEQAAGIVGNFMWESGGENLPPDVNQGVSPGPPAFSGGYGWAQWTGGRQRSFIDFAIEQGFMASESEHATDAANYAYLKKELADPYYKDVMTSVKATSSPEDASDAWERTFERAGVSALSERASRARKAFDEYSTSVTSGTVHGSTGGLACGGGFAAIVGDNAFPLITTKSKIENKGIFHNNTTDIAGHPYTAYDILTTEGTPVAAFLSGTVTRITQDKCPGQMISVYNPANNLTISYLHLDFNNHVSEGDELLVGQQLAVVGPAANGCGTVHLHIDAAEGKSRPGCSREKCPSDNKKKFKDIGPELYKTYQSLPE